MKTETKTVQAQLIGLEGHEGIPNVTVKITHHPEVEAHKYITSLTLGLHKPEIDGNSYNLKLGDHIEGLVTVYLAGSASDDETNFVVAFHDPIWHTTDWFKKL